MKRLIIIFSIFVCFVNLNAQSNWVKRSTSGVSITRASAMAYMGDTLIASTFTGLNHMLVYSYDDGITWVLRDTVPLPGPAFSIFVVNNYIFVGTGEFGSSNCAILKSVDHGWSWTDISPVGLGVWSAVRALSSDGINIFAGIEGGGGVVKSPLSGINSSSWISFNNGFIVSNPTIRSMQIKDSTIYVGTYGKGVFLSSITTNNWTTTSGLPQNSNYINTICVNDNYVYAGNISGFPVIYRSVNSGYNWSSVSTSAFNNSPVNLILNSGPYILASVDSVGVLLSVDSGITWSEYNNGLRDSTANIGSRIDLNLMIKGNSIYAAGNGSFWKSPLPSALNCVAGCNDSLYKDLLQPNTWNVIANYLPGVTNAKWSWGDGTYSVGLYPSHTYANPGKYSICVTSYSSCGDSSFHCISDSVSRASASSAMVYINVVQGGMSEIQNVRKLETVNLYPVPAGNTITVKSSSIMSTVVIYNSLGEVMIREKINGQNKTIDIGKLSPGVYTILIDKTRLKFLKD